MEGHLHPARVVLIEDDPDTLLLVRTQLSAHPHFEVVAEATTGREGIAAAVEHQPDAVLLDLRLPDIEGREALRTIVTRCPRTMVAICSAADRQVERTPAQAAGAFAYYDKASCLHKLSLPDNLAADLELFRAVLTGEDILPPALRHSV